MIIRNILHILEFIKRIIHRVMKFVYTSIVKIQCNSYSGALHVNYRSNVSRTTILGKNINFNGMEIGGSGKVVIGDNFHSGRYCLMITDNHNYGGNSIPYDNSYISKDIIIKENVWLGDRVIILGGITIEEGAIIQAGSVVVKSIPKCAIAGGHPAKVFKYRNVEHYENLKRMGRFH